ncbi:MAG TPA: peptidase MA family metallohydrolase [Candidatus Limnocylindrales bacterium]|nr:peptidase MA family metallohydrolase [Candidatus Limnocylindrales bacterium]
MIITFCCVSVLACAAWADTIVLKRGTRIVVDSVVERNGQVEYTIGDNTLTIPKSIVERIETGPAASAPPARPHELAPEELPAMREEMAVSEDLIARIIRNNQVDTVALNAVQQEGVPAQTAGAFAIAAGFESNKNNLKQALLYLQSALHYLPNHPVLLENYATLLLKLGHPAEGVFYAEQATHANPQSAAAFSILGYAQYQNDHNREAIAALKKSLELQPDDKVKKMLDRVERESKTEADFHEQESSHFTLRYEGSQADDGLRQKILDTLEEDYRALEGDLGATPHNIVVSLYTDQAFFDVTQAPAWSAALNDGKIRVPISGVTAVTPELARVLRHELTHSFVAQITHHHVPQWLNEGIAELEQGTGTSAFGARLAALYASGHQVPLNMLEGNFDGLSKEEAFVAYAESIAAVEYIRANFGMGDLARILQRLGDGQSIEAALRTTIHGGYAEMETDLTEYLKKNYGT